MPEKPCTVVPSPPAWRPAALRKLHDALPGDLSAGLAQALHVIGVADAAAWDGLLIVPTSSAASAVAADEIDPAAIAAVAWVQQLPGDTACLWIPPVNDAAGLAVMQAAAAFVDERHIPLTQLVASPDDGYADSDCELAGFPRFATLRYFYVDLTGDASPSAAHRQPAAPVGLHFAGHAEREAVRLQQLIEQTYVGTLDCPQLDGVRPLAEVLAGYRSQGTHRPEQWYIAQAEGQDVGVLILAEHPGLGNWEVVYMGVAAAARGRGYGAAIVEFAMSVATSRHAERLVLAVDAANEPALKMYRKLGFITWAERVVYARLRARA